MNKAYEYSYGDREDFEIALIPMHTRQEFSWFGGEHWMLGIYDRRGLPETNFLHVYDPLKQYGPDGKIKEDHLLILRHALNTLHPSKCTGKISMPQGLAYNQQEDGNSCGVFIYLYAKLYLLNNGRTMIENLDISHYRSEIREIARRDFVRQKFVFVKILSNVNQF